MYSVPYEKILLTLQAYNVVKRACASRYSYTTNHETCLTFKFGFGKDGNDRPMVYSETLFLLRASSNVGA